MEKPVTERPADLLSNELPQIEKELKQKLGFSSVGIDDVMKYAMFPQVALKFFETRSKGPVTFEAPSAKASSTPSSYVANVDNKDFKFELQKIEAAD